nr:hypothetical protein [Tanacetum cinerariifolium]
MAGNKDGVWVVDSGCTEYITHKSNLLENKKGTSNEALVAIPNGYAIPVEGKGDFILPGGAKINGVLHIPNFKHNLLFVSRICKDLQCAVTFFPNFFVMQGLRTRSLIGSEKWNLIRDYLPLYLTTKRGCRKETQTLARDSTCLTFRGEHSKKVLGRMFLTVAYIINRLSSEVIKNKTPYELVWNEEPKYEDEEFLGV